MTPQELARNELKRRGVWGYFEPLIAMAHGAVAEVGAGLGGLATLGFTGDPSQAAQTVKNLQDKWQYDFASQEGKESMQAIGETLAPIGEAMEWTSQTAGDWVYDATGNEALAAAAYSAPTAFLELLALKGVRQASKAGKLGDQYEVGDIGTKNKQAGIFGGVTAKTADLDALKKAKEMASQGASREEIWDSTGWWERPDGWHFEIPDEGFKLVQPSQTKKNPEFLARMLEELPDMPQSELKDYADLLGYGGDLEGIRRELLKRYKRELADIGASYYDYGEVFTHPGLEAAYPNISDVSVRFKSKASPFMGGASYQRLYDQITLTKDDAMASSSGLHELQHATQYREGFKGGSSPSRYSEAMIKKSPIYKQWEAEKPLRDEIDNLRQSPEYKAEIAETNRLYKDKYGKQMKDLEGRYDAGEITFDEYSDLFDEIDAQYKAEAAIISPTMTKADNLARQRTIAKEPTADTLYFHDAGEVIARMAQKRRHYSPEQRKRIYPWNDYSDIIDEQYIDFGGKTPNNIIGVTK